MKSWIKHIYILLMIFCCHLSGAEDLYFTQAGAGSHDGSSVGNAWSLSEANTSGNWGAGAGKVSAGDTLHVSGTITNPLVIAASGTVGSPVTIMFETGANFTTAVWPITGAINLDNKSYLTIDGGVNGLIKNTANGTVLANQLDTSGVVGDPADNVIVQNLTVTNLYVRTPGSLTDGTRYGIAVQLHRGNNFSVLNCTLSDGDTMIAATWTTGSVSNWTFAGNTLIKANHTLTLGTSDVNAFLSNVLIASNRIDKLDVWDGHSNLHMDGMIIFNEAPDYSGSITDMTIYANEIGPDIGTMNTAGIFIDDYQNSQMVRLRIYNNVLRQRAPYSWNNGHISARYTTNSVIANNTFISYSEAGIGIQMNSGNLAITNNLFYDVGTALSLGPATEMPTGFHSDNNIFFGIPPTDSGSFYAPNWAAANLAWWQDNGFDLNSTTNQPTLDGNYAPTSGDTVAKGQGVNLSAYFTTDKNGVTRSGAWDIGAYQYQAGGGGGPTVNGHFGTVTVGNLRIQ